MQVAAFSTPSEPDWRWRIVNYAGEVIEESRDRFPSIASAVAVGTKRLRQMDVVDRSTPTRTFRSTSHLRHR
jgi:FPC/CPF motif-containing protein YcgG